MGDASTHEPSSLGGQAMNGQSPASGPPPDGWPSFRVTEDDGELDIFPEPIDAHGISRLPVAEAVQDLGDSPDRPAD